MKFIPPLVALLTLLGAAAQAQDKLDLRLHFNKGDVRQTNLTLDESIGQTVQDAQQRTMQSLSIGYSLTVDDLDAQGNAIVSIHYDSIAFHSKSPAGEVDYDSTKQAANIPPMVGGMAALLGQGYWAKISPAGNVEQVSGLDALLKTVSAKLNIPEGPARAAADKLLRQQLDEQNLKIQLQSMFAPLPDRPVAIGESWYRKTQLMSGIPLTLETTYTLKARESGIAIIELAGRASTPDHSAIDAGLMKVTYDLHGEVHGQ